MRVQLGGIRALSLATFAGLALWLAAGAQRVEAGAFTFAGEANGINLVTHPEGYTGTGGTVNVTICIDPTSANAAAMEIPVQNLVKTWNELSPATSNSKLWGANDLASNEVDFESLALHEVGHCLGLAHPNAASESGLTGHDRNYTRATDGANDTFDIDDGVDNLIGSGDDVRGDDVNLHWFRISNNDPFTIATIVDSTTYSRDVADLPPGDIFPANADRDVATLLGAPNTEAVMQQGSYFDEEQRLLGHDDVATLRYGMSGLDELEGTSDDYTVSLTYSGLTTSCDMVLDFDNAETALASCELSGFFINSNHVQSTNPKIYFNDSFNWYFTPTLDICGNGSLDLGEECDDGNLLDGDCCSPTCQLDTAGASCGDATSTTCNAPDSCDGAGGCLDNFAAASVECRADAGACDIAENCDGAGSCPADAFEPITTVCRTAAGVCDAADMCGGTSAACSADAKLTSQCRAAADVCDLAETCDGITDSCPADAFEPITTVCRAAADVCDAADMCGGTNAACPADAKRTSQCRAAADICDLAETCDGITDSCPADAFEPITTVCRAAAGVCDTADLCTGSSVSCPADEAIDCEDNNACTADSCDEFLGCVNDPIPECGSVPALSNSTRLIVAFSFLLLGALALGRRVTAMIR